MAKELKTFRTFVFAGGYEEPVVVSERKPLEASDVPENAFGFYFFDANPAELKEDPKKAERTNVSGITYVGMVHKASDILWDVSQDEMARRVRDAETDKVVVCRYGSDTAMILPFREGTDTFISPVPLQEET